MQDNVEELNNIYKKIEKLDEILNEAKEKSKDESTTKWKEIK